MTRFPRRFPVLLFVGIPWWIALPFLIFALYLYLAYLILWVVIVGTIVLVHAIASYTHHRRVP